MTLSLGQARLDRMKLREIQSDEALRFIVELSDVQDLIDQCREDFGPEGEGWNFKQLSAASVEVTFTDREKALLFKLRWT